MSPSLRCHRCTKQTAVRACGSIGRRRQASIAKCACDYGLTQTECAIGSGLLSAPTRNLQNSCQLGSKDFIPVYQSLAKLAEQPCVADWTNPAWIADVRPMGRIRFVCQISISAGRRGSRSSSSAIRLSPSQIRAGGFPALNVFEHIWCVMWLR